MSKHIFTSFSQHLLWFCSFIFLDATTNLNAEENTDINYPSENSPLLQIRGDINHDSNKEAQDGNLKTKNSLYEMSNLSYLPEGYCHQHKKVGGLWFQEKIFCTTF